MVALRSALEAQVASPRRGCGLQQLHLWDNAYNAPGRTDWADPAVREFAASKFPRAAPSMEIAWERGSPDNRPEVNFFFGVKKLDPTTSSGLSGWSAQLLRALGTCHHSASGQDAAKAIDELGGLWQRAANCELPPVVTKMMFASRLVMIPKPNGGWRPIAVPETGRSRD